jgi:hypothetical protein
VHRVLATRRLHGLVARVASNNAQSNSPIRQVTFRRSNRNHPCVDEGFTQVDEGFTQIDLAAVPEVLGEASQQPIEAARVLPELDATMATLVIGRR